MEILTVPAAGLDSDLSPRSVLQMFSVEQALRFPLCDLKAWTVHARCDRCHRKSHVPLRLLIRRDDRRLLADVLTAMRCRQCHAKPSAALLTNAREPSEIRAFFSLEKGNGHFQIVLWDDGARR
jgi:hypothetical protein